MRAYPRPSQNRCPTRRGDRARKIWHPVTPLSTGYRNLCFTAQRRAYRLASKRFFHYLWGVNMRWLLALVLTVALADAIAGETYRFDRGVVSVGDSTGALIQRAGEPSRKAPIENRFGAKLGERWEYDLRGKSVSFVIRDGKIQSIEEQR